MKIGYLLEQVDNLFLFIGILTHYLIMYPNNVMYNIN